MSLPPNPNPNGLWVTNTHKLAVTTWGSLAGVVLTLTYRIERPDSKPTITPNQIVPDSGVASGGTAATIALGNGYLTVVSVTVTTGSPKRGQTWVQVSLVDSTGGPRILLIARYAVVGVDLSWTPGNPNIEDPLSGQGLHQSFGMSPSAGADINYIVSTTNRIIQKIGYVYANISKGTQAAGSLSVRYFALTTDGGRSGPGTLAVFSPGSPQALAKSTNKTFILIPGYGIHEGSFDYLGNIRLPLPIDLQTSGMGNATPTRVRLRSVTNNLKSADAWTVSGYGQEYIDPS